MNQLQNEIKTLFESHDFVPDKSSLVVMDGYDELEKKGAIKFFSGKDCGLLLTHLRTGEPYYLEEWTVLKLDAIIHYAPAYFYYLLENLAHQEPDEEYVFFLIGALYQLIYMHKGSPFNPAQTDLIVQLVKLSEEKSKAHTRFEYFSEDIQNSVKEFMSELGKYTS